MRVDDKPEAQLSPMTNQGGTEKSPKPKPLLTSELKAERLLWCQRMLERIEEYGDKTLAGNGVDRVSLLFLLM